MIINPNLTKITFTPTVGTAVTFQERSVQPGGYEGSDKVDITSSRSPAQTNGVVIKQYVPGNFIEMSAGGASVLYDPAKKADILAIVNIKGTILITYNDSSTESQTGWIKSFVPTSQDTVDNTNAWTADIVIEFTKVTVAP